MLTNEIHLDKYPSETMMELKSAMPEEEDEEVCLSQEREDQLAQVLAWQNF